MDSPGEKGQPRPILPADLPRMKGNGRPIVMVTAYDYPTAAIGDKSGVDVILVGDSLGMVVLGYDSTVKVTMEDMIHHCKAVARATKHALVVVDMPFMSYNITRDEALRNAGRLVKEGGAKAVKLEGGRKYRETVSAIIEAEIPVMGHIGLKPQAASLWSGYKVHGRTAEEGLRIFEDAIALQEAGAFAIILELTTSEVAKLLKEKLRIPVIGIGAGPNCDGQVLVYHDLMGLYSGFVPKFVKRYADLTESVGTALSRYCDDVRGRKFPSDEHSFHMEPSEEESLRRKAGEAK